MYNDNVTTSKDNEAYVAGQPLFYGKPNPQAAKVAASQQSNQPIQHTITRPPPAQYVLSPPLHPGQTTRIVPREKQRSNGYIPLIPRTATSVLFLSEQQSTSNEQTSILNKENRENRIKLTSYNCKNIKTCGNSINEILKDNDIILIQEHWLFHSQTSIISDINSDINFVAKGVDLNDPLLPVSLPRGYG